MFCIVIAVREAEGLKNIALHDCLRIFYFFRRYKFAMKAILCNAECVYIVESNI